MPEALVGEFKRKEFLFTVYRESREVHRVDVRKGDAPAVPVVRVFPYASPEWSSNWRGYSWRPWIYREARLIIAEAQDNPNDHTQPVATQPDHIAE